MDNLCLTFKTLNNAFIVKYITHRQHQILIKHNFNITYTYKSVVAQWMRKEKERKKIHI